MARDQTDAHSRGWHGSQAWAQAQGVRSGGTTCSWCNSHSQHKTNEQPACRSPILLFDVPIALLIKVLNAGVLLQGACATRRGQKVAVSILLTFSYRGVHGAMLGRGVTWIARSQAAINQCPSLEAALRSVAML